MLKGQTYEIFVTDGRDVTRLEAPPHETINAPERWMPLLVGGPEDRSIYLATDNGLDIRVHRADCWPVLKE